jgi:hypothetical protein
MIADTPTGVFGAGLTGALRLEREEGLVVGIFDPCCPNLPGAGRNVGEPPMHRRLAITVDVRGTSLFCLFYQGRAQEILPNTSNINNVPHRGSDRLKRAMQFDPLADAAALGNAA